MAKQTKTVSGTTTTYVITDQASNTVTVVVTQVPGAAITSTFTSSGALLNDGTQLLTTLTQLIATGIVP